MVGYRIRFKPFALGKNCGKMTYLVILLMAFTIIGCSTSGSKSLQDADQKFIQWYNGRAKLLLSDFTMLRIALESGNVNDARVWAKEMKSNAKDLLNQINGFKVSNDLHPAKIKCENYLTSMERAANGILDFLENDSFDSYDSALRDLNVAFEELNQTESYIKAYCASHQC